MNPEDNNPLTNSGIPNLGVPSDSINSSGLTSPISTDLSSISSLADSANGTPTENPFAPPAIEDPLVPAAPVPGSIGSVTSVPADVAPAPSNPLASNPNNPLDAPSSPSTPTQTPYNPFAQTNSSSNQATMSSTNPITAPSSTPNLSSIASPTSVPSTPTPDPIPTPMPASAPTMPPPVQPTAAPKMKKPTKSSSMTVLLAIVAVLGIIAAIVLAIMYFNAINNPKVVYVPSLSEDNTNDSMQILTCTKSSDFNYLIGYDHEVIGKVSVVADYTNDKLSSIEFDYDATFDSEGDANVASNNFSTSFNTQGVLVGTQAVEGNTMKSTYNLIEGADLTDSIAQNLIYGEGATNQDLSIGGVEAHYTASGFSCSTE